MTQPQIQGPPVPDEESLAYEAAAVAAVVGPVAAALASVLASAGVLLTGGAAGLVLAGVLADKLRSLHVPDMSGPLEQWTAGAVRLGVRTALEDLGRPDMDVSPTPPPVRPDLSTVVRTKLNEAADIAQSRPLATKSDLEAVAGRARSGVARAEAATRYAVNHGINSGTADVARAAGLRILWVAERNACLHCLAYAGWAVEPGDEFPYGMSFDPLGGLEPYEGLPHPPLHPNCRCRVRTYSGPAGAPPPDRSMPDPAARLAGEARRSVVYQWTDYASGVAAQRAAAALLGSGAGLAVSVEQRARAALSSGRLVDSPFRKRQKG